MNFRIGLGTDIHQLKTGNKLLIGGVEIHSEKSTVAHSDGDVLIHALCDALLGAINEADIGTHFPNTDKRYRNINSETLLQSVKDMLCSNGYEIVNIDSIIYLEKPKLQPYTTAIKKNLANILSINSNQISVKAKTNEGLDSVGTGKAIKADCIVLLNKMS